MIVGHCSKVVWMIKFTGAAFVQYSEFSTDGYRSMKLNAFLMQVKCIPGVQVVYSFFRVECEGH